MDSFVQNVFTIIGFGAELFFVETGVCIRRKDGEVTMDREKVISGLEHCRKYGTLCGLDCNGHYEYTDNLQDIIKANNHRKDCPYGRCRTGCVVTLVDNALALLKEQNRLIAEARNEGYNEAYRSYCVEVAEEDQDLRIILPYVDRGDEDDSEM